MKAIYEFRINRDYADRLFAPTEGKSLGLVRIIHITPDDPRFARIGELEQIIHRETDNRRFFFAGWDIQYQYSGDELEAAEAFVLFPTHTFEPCGEECGTTFDESTACPECGAGVRQTSDLRLDLRKTPKKEDLARTIAGEVVVSQRLAELMLDEGLRGFELCRVLHKARYEDDPLDLSQVPTGRTLLELAETAGVTGSRGSFDVWLNRTENAALWEKAQAEYAAMKRRTARARGKPTPRWYQLLPSQTVEILPCTRTGVNPFDEDEKGEFRCSRGDTIGLNRLSELWISRRDFETCKSDIAVTKQYLGMSRGFLRPERSLIISPGFRRFLKENSIKGFDIEVAHLTD